MAMMDDPEFLVNHLRNSYITSDDTGMCELIMESEEAEHAAATVMAPRTSVLYGSPNQMNADPNTSDSGMDSDCELSHSYDILPDMDYGAHRRRSNTAVRLEKLKKDKKAQVKVKHVPWRSLSLSLKDSEGMFERKDPVAKLERDILRNKRTSMLADLIDTYGVVSNNPFITFAQFDGRANLGMATKKIDIYLTMAPPRDRPFPMTVVMVASAKVSDLIGYICWQYTSEGREPPLQENHHCYSLHIAEDDGEVDTDFPALNVKEPVHKFGFSKLALVERVLAPVTQASDSFVVTIFNVKEPVHKFSLSKLALVERVLAPVAQEPVHKFGFSKLALVERVLAPVAQASDSFVVTIFPALNVKEPVHKFGFSKLALVERVLAPVAQASDSFVVTIFNVKEPVDKFGFSKLALVERVLAPVAQASDSFVVTINIPEKGFSKVPVDDLDIQLRTILDRVVGKRKMISRPGIEYNLERQSQPGVTLDLDTRLCAYDPLEFCLVRQNSSRGDASDTSVSHRADSMTSHRYKNYIVSLSHKLRTSTDVQLGISGTKVDIDPVNRKSATRLFRFKATTIDIDNVVACHMVEQKTHGKATFRVTYLSHNEYKHLDFDCAHSIASEIVQKLNGILEWRFTSPTTSPVTPIVKDRRSWRHKRDSLF